MIRGLVDDVEVSAGEDGGTIRELPANPDAAFA